MRHSALSILLLVGFGLGPALGLMEGGSINFGKVDHPTQQSTDENDGAETGDAPGDKNLHQATDDGEITWCTGDFGSTCSGRQIRPAE